MKAPEDSTGTELVTPGSLSRTLQDEILAAIPVADIVKAIRTLLDSTDSRGMPDARGIAAGVDKWVHTLIGTPVARQHIITEKINTTPSPEALLANPATRDTLRRLLDQVDARALTNCDGVS